MSHWELTLTSVNRLQPSEAVKSLNLGFDRIEATLNEASSYVSS